MQNSTPTVSRRKLRELRRIHRAPSQPLPKNAHQGRTTLTKKQVAKRDQDARIKVLNEYIDTLPDPTQEHVTELLVGEGDVSPLLAVLIAECGGKGTWEDMGPEKQQERAQKLMEKLFAMGAPR